MARASSPSTRATRATWIIDNRTGRLVDSSNRSGFVKPLEDRLADLLVTLAGDAPQRARLASGAAAYAGEHFWTWDQRMAAEVEAVAALAAGARSNGAVATAPVIAVVQAVSIWQPYGQVFRPVPARRRSRGGPPYPDTILSMLEPERQIEAPRGSFLGHVNVVMLTYALDGALAFASGVLVARALGPDGRGAFALFIVTTAIAQMVLGIGFGNAAVYFINKRELALRDVVSAAHVVTLGSLAIMAAAVGAIAPWAGDRVLGSTYRRGC